jgi:two-component system sensor histidine kinase RegB
MMSVTTATATFQPRQTRSSRGRLRVRTLAVIRWIAVAGQAAALLVVQFGLGYQLPLLPCLVAVAALALVNLLGQIRRRQSQRLMTDREAAFFFAFDIVQLAILLYLTGGLHNPFSVLILAPVTVAAAALSLRSTLGLAALSILSVNVLAIYHMPLPWGDGSFVLPRILLIALAIALALAVIFITFYVFRVAEEMRRMSDALSEAQASLDREQRLSSLGALAAAAAHELGSPLGTISVIAKELAHDLPEDSPFRSDVDLLLSQSARCREILKELSSRPAESGEHPFEMIPATLMVELAAAPHQRPHVALRIEAKPDPVDPAVPLVPHRPEILHAFGNLMQNAIEFAQQEVKVDVAWSREWLSIVISDDGAGFPDTLLARLGDPYLSSAARGDAENRPGDHMGLGIFIAQNLIERTGGTVGFQNNTYHGAEVRVTWPRESLEND